MRDFAIYYQFLGFSILPLLPGDKKPLYSALPKDALTGKPVWEPLIENPLDVIQIEKIWMENPMANIGIICGKTSGIVVVDFDLKVSDDTRKHYANEEEIKKEEDRRAALFETVLSITPSGAPRVKTWSGWHFYFRLRENESYAIMDHILGEFKGEGYVVAPPSFHKKGNQYEWITGLPRLEDFPFLTEEFMDVLFPEGTKQKERGERPLWKSPIFVQTDPLLKILDDLGNAKMLRFLSGKDLIFKKNIQLHERSGGGWQIWVENQSSDSFLDERDKIGSRVGGGPMWYHWVRRCYTEIGQEKEGSNKNFVERKIIPWLQKNAPELLPKNLTSPKETKWITHDEFLSMPYQPLPFIIDGLIPDKAITALTAASGIGKSLVMQYLIPRVSRGEKIFDRFETQKTNVAVIDQEMNIHEMRDRIQSVSPFSASVFYMTEQTWHIDDPSDYENLKKDIVVKEIGLVVFDTFIMAHQADENSSKEMAPINALMLKLIKETGIAILFLHHNRKQMKGEMVSQDSSRGSSEIIAKVSSHLVIEAQEIKKEGGKIVNRVTLIQKKKRGRKKVSPFAFDIEVQSERETLFTYAGEVDEMITVADRAAQFIVKRLKTDAYGMPIWKMKEESGFSEKSLRDAAEDLVSRGKLRKEKRAGETAFYYVFIP